MNRIENGVIYFDQKTRKLSDDLNFGYCMNCGKKRVLAMGFANWDFPKRKIIVGLSTCSIECHRELKKRTLSLQQKISLRMPKRPEDAIPCGCTRHEKEKTE